MPTADQFDRAASAFDAIADAFVDLMTTTPSHFGPDTLAGGTLTLVADLTISTSTSTATSTGRLVRDLADTCRRRADICRSYAADIESYLHALRQFEADDSSLLHRPTRPRRPASWVEV